MSFTIPNVAITIPDGTSRTVYEPVYVVPLLRAVWQAHLTDPANGIKIRPIPDKLAHLQTREVGSIAEERVRLRKRFLEDPTTKAPLFDTIYPGATFDAAVEKAITVEAEMDEDEEKEDGHIAVDDQGNVSYDPALEDLPGIGKELALSMAYRGLTTLAEVAATTPETLAKIPGIGQTKARRTIQAAKTILFGAPEEETLDEVLASPAGDEDDD